MQQPFQLKRCSLRKSCTLIKKYGVIVGRQPSQLLSLDLSLFFFLVCFVPFFPFFFVAHEGCSDGGGVCRISSLYVLKAIMDRIGLS